MRKASEIPQLRLPMLRDAITVRNHPNCRNAADNQYQADAL
jgi:hypothetical protein